MLKEESGSNSASLTLAVRNQQYQQAMSLWSGPNMAYMHQMRQMHPTPGLKGRKAFVCFHKGTPVETKQYLAMSWMLLFPEMLLLKLRLISIARTFLVGFICTTCLFSQGNTGEHQTIYGNVLNVVFSRNVVILKLCLISIANIFLVDFICRTYAGLVQVVEFTCAAGADFL